MRKLKVLVIHSQYQQAGGEDAVVRAEVELLRGGGHEVTEFVRRNQSIASWNLLRKACLLFSTTWTRTSYAEIRGVIAKERPDVAHCHNLVPQISPAAYYACRSAGVPVVQTVHNYRLFCPAGTFFREGQECTDCTRSLAYGVARGCYRNSRVQTAAAATMMGWHRLAGTWKKNVSAYIALSQSCRERFVGLGISRQKIWVKPNFLSQDPGEQQGQGSYALFVGRLCSEKGVLELLQTWRTLPQIPLVLVGDGPLRRRAEQLIGEWGSAHIRLMGWLEQESLRVMMKGARFLVFPSRWPEPFGLTLVEAAACGVPAIAARCGSVPEIIEEHQSGLLFNPLHFGELATQATWAWQHPNAMRKMGLAGRQRYLQQYTAEKNYELLMDIYSSVLTA